MFFDVEIHETLSRTIEIDAESEQDAIDELRDMYNDESIVLDSDDYVDTEFEIVGKSENL